MPLYTIRHALTRPDGSIDAAAVAERAAKLAKTDFVASTREYGGAVVTRYRRMTAEEAHDAAMREAQKEQWDNRFFTQANEQYARDQAARRAQAEAIAAGASVEDLMARRDHAHYGTMPYREEVVRVLELAIEIKRGERKAEAA